MGRGGGRRLRRERARGRGVVRARWLARKESSGSSTWAGWAIGPSPSTCAAATRRREILAEHGPPLTYFRAGMVVGAQSESYRTLRYLVQRLPAMIAPAWLKNATQPIAIDDVLRYLVQAPSIEASTGREVQIGGPDVLTYGEMLDRMAAALGIRRRPRVPVPLLTPVALVAVDRPRHAGRRGGRPTAGRRARRADGRHRPVRRRAVRRRSRSASTRRSAAPSPRIPNSGRAGKAMPGPEAAVTSVSTAGHIASHSTADR